MNLGAGTDNAQGIKSDGYLSFGAGIIGGGSASWTQASGFVQYNKSGTNPQGSFTILVKSWNKPDGTLATAAEGVQTYKITSNAISSMKLTAETSSWTPPGSTTPVEKKVTTGSFTSKVTVKWVNGGTFNGKTIAPGGSAFGWGRAYFGHGWQEGAGARMYLAAYAIQSSPRRDIPVERLHSL